MKKKLEKITKYFGIRTQVIKLNEEAAELMVACISESYSKNKHFEITEELADVLVLFKQIQLFYDIYDEEIEAVMKEKVDRTIKRIKEGYYESHRWKEKNEVTKYKI